MHYNAIVVGARCAGAPTAMLLARRGYRVLLVDRASFPSDTISTHGIQYRGLRYLQEWGLYERILATNCPEVLRWTSHDGSFPLSGTLFKANGLAALVCPRRTVLDKLLVDAAVESGVELRENFSVHEVVMENGCVCGILGRSGHGPLQEEKGQIIIGADGKHSLVARTVQAPTYSEVPSLRCWYYAYWTNLQLQPATFRIFNCSNRDILLMPTNDNLTCVLIGWPRDEFDHVRANVDQEYRSVIQNVAPEIATHMHDSERVGPYMGTADVPNFFRKPFGAGWALVGDAGYHKDPVFAQGISDAFRDADLLARAIDAGLSGEKPMQEALAEYERLRNEDAFPRYEQNCAAASFAPPSESDIQFRSALRCADQSDVDTFFSALLGTASAEAFFAPANLERILTAGRQLQ